MNPTRNIDRGKGKAPLYVRVPLDVIDRALSCGPHAVAVLMVLYRRASGAGESYPSAASIADDAGICRRTVIESLGALEEAGILARENRTKEDGSPDSNLYRVRVGGSACDALGSAYGAQGVVQGGSAYGAHKELSIEELSIRRTSATRTAVNSSTPEDRTLAEWFAERIKEIQPTRREFQPDKLPATVAKWAADIRLMRDRDQRTHEQIRQLLERVQRDEFWRKNILSPSKLREKWDDLELKLKRGPAARAPSPHRLGAPSPIANHGEKAIR